MPVANLLVRENINVRGLVTRLNVCFLQAARVHENVHTSRHTDLTAFYFFLFFCQLTLYILCKSLLVEFQHLLPTLIACENDIRARICLIKQHVDLSADAQSTEASLTGQYWSQKQSHVHLDTHTHAHTHTHTHTHTNETPTLIGCELLI